MNKNDFKISSDTNKTFGFTKGNVSLNFTLNMNKKKDLQDFLSCLNASVVALQEELKNNK